MAAHTALVPYAYLQCFRSVREAVEDSRMGDYLKKAIFEEIHFQVWTLTQTELKAFAKDGLGGVFANPIYSARIKIYCFE